MNLKQIEYIVTIAEEENITKASEKLFISQSALNQQLLNIEKELNTPLFIRANKKMFLTEAGQIYIDYSKKILELKKEAYLKINNLNNTSSTEINLGLTKERGNQMLVSLYPTFHQKYQDVIIKANEINVKNQLIKIKNNELDLGILTITPDLKTNDLNFIHLANEEIILCVPNIKEYTKDYKEYEEVSLSEYKFADFITINKDSTLRTIQNNLFNKNEITAKIIFETESNKISYNLVAAKLGVSLIPESYAIKNEKVFFLKIKEHPKWEIVVAYNKNLTIEEKYLINLCKNYWNRIISSN